MKPTLLLMLAALPAMAQQPHIASTADSTLRVRLRQIDINSGKESVDAAKAPTALTAIAPARLSTLQPVSLRDLSGVAPNFYMSDHGSKLTAPTYVRGIGSRIGEPSIGLYVDGAASLDKSAFDFDFIDLQRVEVLSGPQGTLYGRNAMAGIISIETRSPLRQPGTSATVVGGTYGQFSANAGVYRSFGNRWGLSVNGGFRHRDGFFDNDFDGSRVGRINTTSVRIKAETAPAGRFDMQNTASAEYSMQYGYPYAVVDMETDRLAGISANRQSTYERTLLTDGLRLRWTGGRTVLTAATSYQCIDGRQAIDQDMTSDDIYFVVSRQRQHAAVEEVVLKSKNEGRYRFVTGLFALYRHNVSDVEADYFRLGYTSVNTATNGTAAAAVFHQSTLVGLLPGLTLTAGIRLDAERMTMRYESGRRQMADGRLTNPTDTDYPAQEWCEVSPRIAADYDLTSMANVYVTVAKGYKAGGFNYSMSADDVAAYPHYLTYDPEQSLNYEAGLKLGAADGPATLRADVFFIDWRHQHIYQPAPSKRGSMIRNAGHTRSRGFEVSASLRGRHGWDALVNFGYTLAKFVRYRESDTERYDGNVVPYAPRQTVVAQVNKSVALGATRRTRLRVSLTYKGFGKIYWSEDNRSSQSYYDLVDLRVAASVSGLSFGLWGRNVFDRQYQVFRFSLNSTSDFAQLGQPANFGAFASVRL